MKKIFLFFISTLLLITLFPRILKAQDTTNDGQTHSQPVLISLTTLFGQSTCDKLGDLGDLPCGPTCGRRMGRSESDTPVCSYYDNAVTGGSLGVNFYANPQIVARNYVLSKNDNVCLNDILELKYQNSSGEWFSKGGPIDSPPITWVTPEQLKQIINRVIEWHKNNRTDITFKDILGEEIPIYAASLGDTAWAYQFRWIYGTLICTPNIIAKSSTVVSGNEIKITKEGPIELEITTQPTCLFYEKMIGVPEYDPDLSPVYPNRLLLSLDPSSPYLQSILIRNLTIDFDSDWISATALTKLTTKITLNVVSESKEPILEIVSKSSVITDNQTTIMLVIKNTGDANAILDNVTSSIPLTIINRPSVIKPGETVEVYLQTPESVDADSLYFELSYRSDILGCLNSKEKGFQLIVGCIDDSQCSENRKCCQNLCRDLTKGTCRDLNGDGIPDWLAYQ